MLYWCVALAGLVTTQGATCTADNGPVNCEACSQSGYASNDIAGYPRVTPSLAPTPSNLGKYDWVQCTATSCTPNFSPNDFVNVLQAKSSGSTSARSPARYFGSLTTYVAFAIVLCVLMNIACICFCCGRYCCDCCPCISKGGAFGKRYPTRKVKLLGYTALGDGKFGYPLYGKWGSRIFMGVFLFFLLLWIGMGQFKGNSGITNAMKAVAASPTNLVRQLKAAAVPVGDLLQNAIVVGLIPTLRSINSTVLGACSLDVLLAQADCMLGQVNNFPNSTKIREFVNSLEQALGDVSDIIAVQSQVQINYLNQQTTILQNGVGNIVVVMQDANRTLQYTRGNVSIMAQRVDELIVLGQKFQNLSNVIQPDLLSIQKLPNATDESDCTNTGGVIIGTPAPSPAQINAALVAFTRARDKYLNTPNYTKTADNMDSFNDEIDNTMSAGLLTNLDIAINDTREAVNRIYGTTARANATIQQLLRTVANFSLQGVADIVDDIRAVIAGVPSFQVLIDIISPVLSIRDAIPCFTRAVDEVLKLNTSVLALPSTFDVLTNITNQVNNSVQPAVDAINLALSQIQDYQSQRDALNFSGVIQSIRDAENQVQAKANNLDTASLLSNAQNAENQALTVDFSSEEDVRKLNDTLQTKRLSNKTISDLRTFQPLKVVAIEQLNLTIATLSGFATSGTVDRPQIANGIAIVQLTVSYNPFVSSDLQTLDDVVSNATQAYNTSQLEDQLQSVQRQIEAVNISQFSDSVQRVQDALSSFNVSDYTSKITDINSTVNSINFNSVNSTLTSMQSSFDQANQQLDQARKVRNFLQIIRDFLYLELPRQFAKLDTLPTVRQTSPNNGYSAMLLLLSQVFDDLVLYLNNATQYLNYTIAFNATGRTATIRTLLDEAVGDSASKEGPIYYLLNLATKAGQLPPNTMTAPQSGAARWDVNANGQPYPNGSKCYTTRCLNNFIDYINDAKISTVSQGTVPVAMSRKDAIGLPYLLPFTVFILGTVALVLSLLPVCSDSVIKCITGTMTCCMFCQMPWIFIFAGLFWPFVLVMGDVCYGMENIGYNVIQSPVTGQLCSSLNGAGTISSCQVSRGNVSVNINFPGMYRGLLGGQCSPDPLSPFYGAVATAFADLPTKYAPNYVEQSYNGIALRDPMKTIMYSSAQNFSTLFLQFIGSASRAVSCNSLHLVYSGFKDSVCCDVVTAFYWAIGSWLLIAWTYCCCGCYAGLLAYKRFPHHMWGPEWHSDEAGEGEGEGEGQGEKQQPRVVAVITPGAQPVMGQSVRPNHGTHQVEDPTRGKQNAPVELNEMGSREGQGEGEGGDAPPAYDDGPEAKKLDEREPSSRRRSSSKEPEEGRGAAGSGPSGGAAEGPAGGAAGSAGGAQNEPKDTLEEY